MLVRAALKNKKTEEVFTGFSHRQILEKHKILELKNYEEGFLTDTNEFLNRDDAKEHAYKYNQISDFVYKSGLKLISSDINFVKKII